MKKQVIAFTGISGVGKTTFLKELAKQVSFQHLTGGSLIAAARQAESGQRDKMRHANLDENQRLLISGFAVARDPKAGLVIMDGHVVIDDGNSLIELPSTVFRALGASLMIHLEADPAWIAANRSRDKTRSRPQYTPDTLEQHQYASRSHAATIASELNIGFHIVTHTGVGQFPTVLLGYRHP